VRTWIQRYGVAPLGSLGRWPAYDYRELAAIDARLRGFQESEAA
jgi:hypothetical protein